METKRAVEFYAGFSTSLPWALMKQPAAPNAVFLAALAEFSPDGPLHVLLRSQISEFNGCLMPLYAPFLETCRSLVCERSVVARADGSARWAQDHTCVIAAVYGPKEAGPRNEDPTQAAVEVVFQPMSGLSGSREADYERLIGGTLEAVIARSLNPRTEIQVVLQVAGEDGSVLPCALNAACVALVDAGVPLTRMFAAVGCAYPRSSRFSIDPDAAEEASSSSACFVYPSAPLRGESPVQASGVRQAGTTAREPGQTEGPPPAGARAGQRRRARAGAFGEPDSRRGAHRGPAGIHRAG